MDEKFDIAEPEVKKEDILLLEDPAFVNENVCIVTGAGSGIGRAVAIASAVNGLLTLGVDYNEKAVAKTAEIAAGLGGKMDIVVLNAGVGDVGPSLADTEQPLIEKVTKINHWGVLYGLKHAPASMNDGGSIISTSSMAAFISVPGSAVYSAGKRAVVSLTEMAALELGHRNIRVNCVCPGYTATALGSGEEGQKICEAFTALGRVADVDDMSGVYLFLASQASRYMTGQALKVDGGWDCGPTNALLELVTGSGAAPS